jgi:flagellar biosynthesis chaperone FliJ
MRFRFRLQKALDFAHMRERRKQNQINSSQQREKILIHYLEQSRSQVRNSLKRLSADPVSPIVTILYQAIEVANEDGKRLEGTLAEERAAQVKLKGELIRLVMRRKALEALKDKRYADHRLAERRHEQKILDEVSNVGWQRAQEESEQDE